MKTLALFLEKENYQDFSYMALVSILSGNHDVLRKMSIPRTISVTWRKGQGNTFTSGLCCNNSH